MIYHLRQFPVHVALLEATGGLEQEIALALHKAGWRVNMANPRKAAHFIRSQENAKTNNSDAKMLARYARNLIENSARHVNYFMPPDPKRVELEALIKRRSELIGMRVAEQNCLSGAHKRIQGEIQRNIASLNKSITKLELTIEKASNHFREFFDKICIVESLIKSNESKEPKQQGIHISQPPLFPQPFDPCPRLLYRVEIRAIGRKPHTVCPSACNASSVSYRLWKEALSITITLHAGSSGSSISVAHVWKTSLSMLQSKAVKANGTVPHRAPITLVCALLHPDTPAHFCPRGA